MMVNTSFMLMILVVLTLIVWLVQELIGRRQQQWRYRRADRARRGHHRRQSAPSRLWSDWAFKILIGGCGCCGSCWCCA